MPGRTLLEFDVAALYAALDARRLEYGLSWRAVADELWALSWELNARRDDHPISPSTLTGMQTRRATSCQHALFMLRWLGRSPESFLACPPGGQAPQGALPAAGPDRRLRWRLKALYEALDAERRARRLSWPQAAAELRCTPSQLTGLRTARFATGIGLAMRIVQWLERPAADFIYAARW
jgi:hypothetical protein